MTMLVEGEILLDRYQIRQLLGQGGFGQVHLALDTRLDRKCAIKASQATSEAAVQARSAGVSQSLTP
jgi:hypothetical protein